MMVDKVILRRWKYGDKELIALFPDIDAGPGLIAAYMHIGQHGGADRQVVVARTRPVDTTDADAVELLAELRQIGYEV